MPAFIPYFATISSFFRLDPANRPPRREVVEAFCCRLGGGFGRGWRLTRVVRAPEGARAIVHTKFSGGRWFTAAISALSISVAVAQAISYTPSRVIPPPVMREIRAVWVATVANIDWPSTNGVTTTQQKAELVAILDRASTLKLNTIVFQVRPACDALYASSFEPWSEYLTGTMGRAPQPFYDPLAFAVEEAHKRGLELHAWFNPYRARHAGAKSIAASTHISRIHPEWVKGYGHSLWLDPGEKAVQDYSLNVVMDVVRRYDIDGVHFDDYFYPYKEKDDLGRELDFPDESSWKRYGAGGKLNRDDWRRENVNKFLRRVYESIKSAKPWVKFGVSPFGIWRPGNPQSIQGYDAFAKLYADSRQWLQKGWLDYCAPQLYWSSKSAEQSFPVLLKWWAGQNSKRRYLAPGLDSTKANGTWPAAEIVNQIQLTRKQAGTSGHCHWNMRALMRNQTLASALAKEVYQEPAIFPALTWAKHEPRPLEPRVKIVPKSGGIELDWAPGPDNQEIGLWLVQNRRNGEWATRIVSARTLQILIEGPSPEVIAITAIDRYGDASKPAVFGLAKK